MLEYFFNLLINTIFNNILTMLLLIALVICLLSFKGFRRTFFVITIIPVTAFVIYLLYKANLIRVGSLMQFMIKCCGYMTIECLIGISYITTQLILLLPFGHHFDIVTFMLLLSYLIVTFRYLSSAHLFEVSSYSLKVLFFCYVRPLSFNVKKQLLLIFNRIKNVFYKRTLILKLTSKMNC